MALVWDPTTFSYVDDGTVDPATAGMTGAQGVLAGNIVPQLGAAQQYGLAMRDIAPGYADNPWARQAISRAQQPLLGQYLMGYDPSATGTQQSFAQWLRGPEASYGAGAAPGRFGGMGQPLDATGAQNWADMMGVARSMGINATPWEGAGGTYDRWADMLQDADNVRALTQMATYDPRAGSIYGGLRQRGMDRAQQEYLSDNPGATGADWLGYITRERPGLVRETFRTPAPPPAPPPGQ